MPTSYPSDVRVDTAGKITPISVDPFTAPWKYGAGVREVYPYQKPDTSTVYTASQFLLTPPKRVPALRPEEV